MGSTSNPRTWIPYTNPKDCSQGFCSPYCPQWCYIIFPPPPTFDLPDDDSAPNFSPLVIAIIGILASAFVLVSYYAIISKYCKNRDSRRRVQSNVGRLEVEENQEDSVQGYWHNNSNVPTNGLDESLIKSITMFKYKKGDGLIELTDCSVCLGEFQEDESLRLLPQCTHAFHVCCIDTWLKSHPNCPLCRANVVFIGVSPHDSPPPALESSPGNESLAQTHPEDIEMGVAQGEALPNDADTQPVGVDSDEQNPENCSTRLDHTRVRRSVSMDHPCRGHLSVVDILRNTDDNEEDNRTEERRFQGNAGPSKGKAAAEMSRFTRPVAMKRSFSSGRFIFSNPGRGRSTIIPL